MTCIATPRRSYMRYLNFVCLIMSLYNCYSSADWKAGLERSQLAVKLLQAHLGSRLHAITSLGKGNDTDQELTTKERASAPMSEADWLIEYVQPSGKRVKQLVEVSGSHIDPADSIWVATHKLERAKAIYEETGMDTVFMLVYPAIHKVLMTSYTRTFLDLDAIRKVTPKRKDKKTGKLVLESYAVLPQSAFKPTQLH